jgi:hypothetical protein
LYLKISRYVVSFYHSIIFSPQIHMVLHGTTFFANEGIFPLFTQLSADYRLRHLVNNVAMHIYTNNYIISEMIHIEGKEMALRCVFRYNVTTEYSEYNG